jgi:hypothetical protein
MTYQHQYFPSKGARKPTTEPVAVAAVTQGAAVVVVAVARWEAVAERVREGKVAAAQKHAEGVGRRTRTGWEELPDQKRKEHH